MKRSRINRIIGAIVCLALVLVMVPVSSYAELTIDGGSTDAAPSGDGSLTIDDGSGNAGQAVDDGSLTIDGDGDASSSQDSESGDLEIDAGGNEQSQSESSDDSGGTTDDIASDGSEDGGTIRGVAGFAPVGAPLITRTTASAEELEEAKRLILSANLTPSQVRNNDMASLELVMAYNSAGAAVDLIKAEKIQAVLIAPDSLNLEVLGNAMYEYLPDDKHNVPGELKIDLTLNSVPPGGSGIGFVPINFFIPKGITDTNVNYPVSLTWYYDGMLLFETQNFSFTSLTDKFEWNNLSGQQDTSEYTLYGNLNNTVGNIVVSYGMANAHSSTEYGVAFTDTVVLEDKITVSEYLQITENQITFSGVSGAKAEIVDVEKDSDGYITSFTFRYTKTNTSLLSGTKQDLTNVSNLKMTITGAKVNDAKARPASTDNRLTITGAVKSTGLTAVATPYPVVAAGAENKATDTLNGKAVQNITADSQFSVDVIRDFQDEGELEDKQGSGKITAKISEVRSASGNTIPGRIGYVYPHDQIVYEIDNFSKSLEPQGTTSFIKIIDTFDNADMYPISVESGLYNAYNGSVVGTSVQITIRLYAGNQMVLETSTTPYNNVEYTVSLEDLAESQSVDLTQVNRVELVYPSTQNNITVRKAPAIVMKVREIGGNTPGQGDYKIFNTVDLEYTAITNGISTTYNYDTVSADVRDDDNNYRVENIEIIYYASKDENDEDENKTYNILRRGDPTADPATLQRGDLLEYTVTFTIQTQEAHEGQGDWYDAKDPYIYDTFEGQVPYMEDDPNNPRLITYGEAPFVNVVSVTDADGRDVTAQRALIVEDDAITYKRFIGGYLDIRPDLKDDGTMMKILLKSRDADHPQNPQHPRPYAGHLQHGDVVVMTYVMEVTDPSKVTNEFLSFADPTGSGSPALFKGTGGKATVSSKVENIVKPTIYVTTSVKNPDGTAHSNNTVVDKDEILTVTYTVSNRGPQNSTAVNLGAFYAKIANVNDVPFFYEGNGISAPVVTYYREKDAAGNPANPAPAGAWTATPSVSSNGTRSANATYKLNGYLELAPDQTVVIEYQIQAAAWLNDNTPYQYLDTYTMFVQDKSYYTATTNSGLRYDWGNDEAAGGKDGDKNTRSYFGISAAAYVSRQNISVGAKSATRTVYLNTDKTHPRNDITSYLNFQNYGREFDVNRIIVRLPQYETVLDRSTDSRAQYDAVSLGYDGDQQIFMITPTGGAYNVAANNAASTAGRETRFALYTHVDDADWDKVMAEVALENIHTSGYVYFTGTMEYAFYSEGGATSAYTLDTAAATALSQATNRSKWGGSQLNAYFPANHIFYQLNNAYTIEYRYLGPAPSMTTSIYQNTNGQYKDRASDTTTYSPQDKIAFGVHLNLNPNTTTFLNTMTAPLLVARLPQGVTFNPSDTAGLNKVIDNYDALTEGGYTYVLMQFNQDLKNQTATTDVKIPVTVGNSYGTMTAEFYLLSYDSFFAVYNGSGQRVAYKTGNSNLGDILSQLPGNLYDYALYNHKGLNVTGKFGFETKKTVSLDKNTAGASVVTADSRDDQTLYYTLQLSNNGTETAYEDVTVIDRLPGASDMYIMDPVDRYSNTTAKMLGHPVVRVIQNGVPNNLNQGSDYTLQYAKESPFVTIVGKDLNLDEKDAGIPSIITWLDPTDANRKEATLFRIALENALPANSILEVTFEAEPLTDENNDPSTLIPSMPATGAVAINTFGAGFKATMGTRKVEAYPEAEGAKVIFPDLAVMTVKGTFFRDVGDQDGIYNGSDQTFFHSEIFLELYEKKDPINNVGQTFLNPDGTYEFVVSDPGDYFVKIMKLPDGYEIYDEVKAHEQGNKFYVETFSTYTNNDADLMTFTKGLVDIVYIRNAAIVESVNGQLEITKTLSALTSGKVNNNTQKFVFRIDYTPPANSDLEAKTFYEVVIGGQTRTITDLPRGTYTVTELDDWATSYQQVGTTQYANNINEITYQNKTVKATVTNERDRPGFLNAIADVVNVFPKPVS